MACRHKWVVLWGREQSDGYKLACRCKYCGAVEIFVRVRRETYESLDNDEAPGVQ